MNDENEVCIAQIGFNRVPLVLVQRCAEVVRRNSQIERVRAIDLSLRIPERREQT